MHEEPIDLEVFSSSFCQRLAEARRVGHDEEHVEHHLDVGTKDWRCFEAHRFPYVLVPFIEVRYLVLLCSLTYYQYTTESLDKYTPLERQGYDNEYWPECLVDYGCKLRHWLCPSPICPVPRRQSKWISAHSIQV